MIEIDLLKNELRGISTFGAIGNVGIDHLTKNFAYKTNRLSDNKILLFQSYCGHRKWRK